MMSEYQEKSDTGDGVGGEDRSHWADDFGGTALLGVEHSWSAWRLLGGNGAATACEYDGRICFVYPSEKSGHSVVLPKGFNGDAVGDENEWTEYVGVRSDADVENDVLFQCFWIRYE